MRWKPKPKNPWRKSFALFPTKMNDGTWVWLERYYYMIYGGNNPKVRRSLKPDGGPYADITTPPPMPTKR